MHILPIHNINQNKLSKPNFKGTTPAITKGILKSKTSYQMDTILHAYRDIVEKLASKTDEGIQFINQNFPNVSVKDCLIFHNCGEDNHSIGIKLSENDAARGLTHIVKRKGKSSWQERIVLDSYMIEDNNKLLSEFDINHLRIFPKERIYMSSEEIEQNQSDEKLQVILENLEQAMLKFRIYLLSIDDKYKKIPDGQLPFNIRQQIKFTESTIAEVKETSKQIPRLQLYKLSKSFDEYLPLSGNMTNYAFQNLGNEKLTITFAPIDSKFHQNLKRLAIYNQDGSLKKVFVTQDDKLVSNTSSKNIAYIADRLEFYNEQDILRDDISGEYLKYLEMYTKSLQKYKLMIDTRAKNLADKEIVGFFHEKTEENLVSSRELCTSICKKYSNSNSYLRRNLCEILGADIKIVKNKIEFPSKEKDKTIQIMNVNSEGHKDLMKIIVKDENSETHYLIHEDNKLVKNYWQNSPHIIPKNLKYTEESKIPDIQNLSDEIVNSLKSIDSQIDNTITEYQNDKARRFEISYQRKIEKENKRELRKQERLKNSSKLGRPFDDSLRRHPEYHDLVTDCKTQLSNALRNIDGGIEEFNKTINEIRQKVEEFYNNHKKV